MEAGTGIRGMILECLSRQSSLVINIVGTDDISQLPRLGTGLTEVWGGVAWLSCVRISVCCFANLQER